MMQAWISRFVPQSAFFRSVLMLSGATLFAQIVNTITLVLLARLYSPEDFGVLSIFVAALGLIAVVASLRFELAISLPERDEDAIQVAALAVVSAALMALATLLLWQPAMAAVSMATGKAPPAGFGGWLVAVGVLIAGLSTTLQYWNGRKKRFADVSKGRLSQALVGSATSIGLGYAAPSAFGLIAGNLAYWAGGMLHLARQVVKHDGAALRHLSVRRMAGMAAAYRSFPFLSVPEALLNSAGWNVPILILGIYLASSDLGQLLLATRVIGLPMTLVGSAVAQVFVAEAPERMRGGTLHAFTRATMLRMLRLGIVPAVLTGILAPFVFPIVFGADWQHAGYIVAWLVPSYLLQFVCSPVSTVLTVLGLMKFSVVIQACGAALRIGAVVLALAFAPGWTVECYALSGAAFYALYCVAILWANRARVSHSSGS